MERSSQPRDGASFLCSPIPRDPTQRLFLSDGASASQTPGRGDSFFDPEVEQMTGLNANSSSISSVVRRDSAAATGSLVALGDSNVRAAKRPRLEAESAAIVKSELLTTEVESLRVQLGHRTERHQIQLKERDLQLTQLRRQLQYALSEEDHARKELKTLTHEAATEKLQLQKKIVELESKLQFVEDSFSEWREKSEDTVNELRAGARKAKLQIQLLNDEIESLQNMSAPPKPVEYSVLESKVKLLEVSLRDKDLEVQLADERIQNASMTLESSKDVRALNERIDELESQERRLKQELVGLIESSRWSAVHDEKLTQMRQKLQTSEQRYAQAQKEIAALHVRQQSVQELRDFFEPIVGSQGDDEAFGKVLAKCVIGAYKKLQTTIATHDQEKKSADAELTRLRKAFDDAQINESALKRQLNTTTEAVESLQLKVAAAARAFSPMQKANEELVALLQSYKSPDDPTTTDASIRLAGVEAVLRETAPLVKHLDLLGATMAQSTPLVVSNYEDEITRLTNALKASESETKKLVTQLEKTERECATLETRLGRGEFNPQTTKVVHLSVNPTSELLGMKAPASEVTALREEVERLRRQLQSSTSSSGFSTTTPTATTTPASKLTTTTSYETVEGQKLLNQRLKEVFQNQIQQYREAVYQLTGFKVDLKKSNGVELLRLRSMYADHDDDELLVRMEPGGALELLETEFCAQINKRVFAYLTTCRSFPAFLSTLTLHLFEKQTFQG